MQSGGLWESSRFILPQFREAITKHSTSLNARVKPELDEQRISTELTEALHAGTETAITTFEPYGDKTIVGIVVKIDMNDRLVKVNARAQTVWIPFSEILNISRV
ncbi:YolD-like family protein [Paenibacillus alkalitolerans]|uniref:YolD-like family protein n=1 Tax=Paenibacillus alkalitolerans TaxID=2799335 RepID=UPI002D7E32EC|nr:YolD-like family protein [Paenibacillus alkalitolerans]